MKYSISTDKAIIEHIMEAKAGEAVLHAFVGNRVMDQTEGVVTSCDIHKRIVTIQTPSGSKHSYGFDAVSIPSKD